MKKIVYSLLLLLSVSCSSAATQSAPTPAKKVETASQAKVAQNQSKGFLTFAMQWRNDVSWLLIADYLIEIATAGLFKQETFLGLLLQYFGVSLVVTCIAAALSTYLHFISEEKEVKEGDKRLTFTKHFLAKWLPLLQVIAIRMLLLVLYIKWQINFNDKEKEKQKRIIIHFLRMAFICLIAAPMTSYLTSYWKLSSDDTIKPRKTTQKFSFLKSWMSYNGSMITSYTIIRIVYQLASLITKEPPKSLLLFIIMAIVIGWNTMIYYTFEKEKIPSEQKTFGHYFFRNTVPILLAFSTLILIDYFLPPYLKAPKNRDDWSIELKIQDFLIRTLLYNLIYGLIVTPILVLIERYLFTKKNVKRDSSEKGHEEAQSKELNKRYNQARSLSTD